MRLSRYFLPILRETPKEAEIVSHRLMLRAGLIRQESAGIYAWLPLGLKVLNKINAIIREEQVRAGAIEVLMPTIQSAELWRDMEPSSVLLPTPEPPKMPMRWPRPQGRRPSMARMPVGRSRVMGSRSSGLTGEPCRL